MKASTLQQVYAVANAPVSSGNWSTQCIRNPGNQQPGISGVFCYQVGGQQGKGNINITKKVVGGTGSFDFILVNPNPAADDNFTLSPPIDGEQTSGFIKDPGTYKITESAALPAGFSLTSIACSRSGTAFNPVITDGGRSAEFALAAGDTVSCTYTNTKQAVGGQGTLKIVKITNGGDDLFNFTLNPGNFSFQVLTSGGQGMTNALVLNAGTYSVVEIVPPSWTLTSAGCLNGQQQAQGSPSGNSVSNIQLDAGEDVVCTFTNQPKGGGGGGATRETLTLRKVVINDDGLSAVATDFALSFSGAGGSGTGIQGAPAVTNAVVKPGNYTLSENGPIGYTLKSIVCTGGSDADGSDGLVIKADEDVVCTFTNDDKADDRSGEETKRFVNRRIDNLLTHGPDRARMLRRLQEGDPPASLKDEPLKLAHGTQPLGNQLLSNQPAQEMTEPRARFSPPGGLVGRFAAGRMGLGSVATHSTGNPFEREWQAPGATADLEAFGDTRSSSSSIISNIAGQLMPLATDASSFKFATSLSELRAMAAQAEEQKARSNIEAAGLSFLGDSYRSPAMNLRPGLDVWVEGHISRYDDDRGGVNREGDFRILYVGADYVVAPGILVGALVQIDDTDEDIRNPAVRGEIEGTGWMAGPYIGIRLLDNLYFDARAAWGQSDNDIVIDDAALGNRRGSFDTDRWLASASLTGNEYFGPWRISPQVGIAYGDETFDRYETSLGQTIAGGGSRIGRVTGTMEIGYRFGGADGAIIEPHVAITGIWNFDSDDLIVNGALIDSEESRAKVEGGILITTPSGIGVRGAAAYDGIGADDFQAVSGSLWINIPLN